MKWPTLKSNLHLLRVSETRIRGKAELLKVIGRLDRSLKSERSRRGRNCSQNKEFDNSVSIQSILMEHTEHYDGKSTLPQCLQEAEV